jgi:outer membrane murein-binding lipoprotein Lpp
MTLATLLKDGSVILARCLNHQTVDRKSAQSAHTHWLAGKIAALRRDIVRSAPRAARQPGRTLNAGRDSGRLGWIF